MNIKDKIINAKERKATLSELRSQQITMQTNTIKAVKEIFDSYTKYPPEVRTSVVQFSAFAQELAKSLEKYDEPSFTDKLLTLLNNSFGIKQ